MAQDGEAVTGPVRTRRRRRRAWGAVAVALSVVGCAPPGPAASTDAIAGLRHTLTEGVAHPVSHLRAGDPAGPRVILVHGTPGSADGWADYLVDPPPGLEIVAIDRPGFGESGPEGPVVSLEAQAAAVAALLPADGRRAILVGHSLGGPIVALVAIRHPDRVAAVVMLAASLDPGLERIHPLQPVGAWGPIRAMLPRAIRNANAELMALKPELERLAELLPGLTAPVLIVHGTKDSLVPFANVAFMQARMTGACRLETVVLAGEDHFLPWAAEPAVRQAIGRAAAMAC